jgi:lipopolysaccharide export system protein LptA
MSAKRVRGAAIVAAMLTAIAPAIAQNGNAPPNALQGFSQNRNQPVAIESATLEVRDKSKVATFSGNVKLVQGDTTLHCRTLVVFYEQNAGAGTNPATTAPGGGKQQIRRLEAKGNVIVTQKDQTATSELAVFEMASNSVTLTGNVVMTQGQNVVRGDKLWVDLTTGVSRVESTKSADGRVRALIQPGSHDGKPDAGNPKGAPNAAATSGTPTRPPGGQGPIGHTGLY